MSLRKRQLDKIRSKAKSKLENKSGIILSAPDKPLIIIIITLIVFGIMAIFSAGAPEGAELGNPAYFAIKQVIFVLMGTVAMLVTMRIDYKKWKNIDTAFALITIGLIALTYIFGRTANGSTRWLAFLPIQPSEFAKLASILLMSSALCKAKTLFDQKVIMHLGMVFLMIILILFQPNLSIALVVSFITFTLLAAGGVSELLLSSTVVAGVMYVIHHISGTSYQLARVTGWLNPWADPQGAGYNLIQSQYAIGSGGLLGVGFGNSKQKLFWLPFRHTDFIFSIIAEELGFIGCLVLIGLFLIFIQRGFVIASRCPDQFGKLFAFGITSSIAVQAFINIGVATGVLPVTGVTLPLISYGGTSVVITMTLLGILLNISRKRIRKIQPQNEAS